MLEYVTTDEYVQLMGTSVPEDFDKLVIEASMYINRKTSGRIEKPSENVKYATCKLINLLEKEKKSKNSNIKSENVDGWSRTYSTPLEIEEIYSKQKMQILKDYLIDEIGKDGLPLLYQGGF